MRRSPLVLLVLLCAFVTTNCSITRVKWRIHTDEQLARGKSAYLEAPRRARPGTAARLRRPNVVILVADDLGKYDVSAYGGRHLETPHIDAIGREGVVFEEAYATAPTCAPSRAGLMTGRVQNRYGFETQIVEHYPTNWPEFISSKWLIDTGDFKVKAKPSFPSEWQAHKQGVPTTEILLSEVFKKHGYRTAMIGKWHLGLSKDLVPNARGFDYQYGFYGAHSLYTAETPWPGIVEHHRDSFSGRYQFNLGRHEEAAVRENDSVVEEEQYLTFAFRDRILDFIELHQDEPFFLYGAFSAPHEPFQAPVAYWEKYAHVKDNNKRVYYAMISALDDAIGAIHHKLKELGLEEQTILYVLSDNGGATYTGATDNGPLKGGKFTQFEGGLNIPFMVKWKGTLPAGLRYEQPVSTTDIFVTSLAAAGAALPDDRPYDGVDLVPYLTGQDETAPHPQLFWRAHHAWALRSGKYKLVLSTRDHWAELYDLEADKSERRNLREQLPALFQELKESHRHWQDENLKVEPLWPRLMDKRIVIDGRTYFFPA